MVLAHMTVYSFFNVFLVVYISNSVIIAQMISMTQASRHEGCGFENGFVHPGISNKR